MLAEIEHDDTMDPAVTEVRACGFNEISGKLDGTKILVIDDDLDGREMLTEYLRALGANVVAVGSAQEALQRVRDHGADILISDIAMPEMDGYELIRRVRALELASGQRIPAIAVTAHVQPEHRARALDSGFDLHVGKPIAFSALLEGILGLI